MGNNLRRAGLILGIAIWVVLGVLLVYKLSHHGTKPKGTPNAVCTITACIKITEQDGTSYNLNDFRFDPPKCINFISLPDKTQRHYCGVYKLDWIGPDTGKGSTI